jgi:hypothetical protein
MAATPQLAKRLTANICKLPFSAKSKTPASHCPTQAARLVFKSGVLRSTSAFLESSTKQICRQSVSLGQTKRGTFVGRSTVQGLSGDKWLASLSNAGVAQPPLTSIAKPGSSNSGNFYMIGHFITDIGKTFLNRLTGQQRTYTTSSEMEDWKKNATAVVTGANKGLSNLRQDAPFSQSNKLDMLVCSAGTSQQPPNRVAD